MTQIDRVRDTDQPQTFPEPKQVMPREAAEKIVTDVLAKWQSTSEAEARGIADELAEEFPDQARPDDFWHSQSSVAFRDFFVWGHDHDFGHGISRSGAMGPRHIEITSEALVSPGNNVPAT